MPIVETETNREGLLTHAVDWVFGYDFFLSYSHGDGTRLPQFLKERLAQIGFRVFLDQTEFVAGMDLPRETRRHIAKSRKLVVIGRPGALQSEWVKREVDVALAQGKIPVVIDVNRAVEAARDTALASTALTEHWLRLNALMADPDGEPPEAIIGELVRGFEHTRQEIKRQRIFAAAAVVLAVMAGVAIWQAIDATRAKMVAEVQRDRAQRVLDQVIAANNRRVQTETRRLHDNGVLYVAPGSAGDAATADSEGGVLLDKANALITQASKLIESENLKGARGPLELALNLLTSRPEAISNDTSWRLALLKAYDRVAVLRGKAGDREDAFAEFNRALGLAESRPNPQDTDWLHVVATLRQDLGDLHSVVATLRQDLGDLHSAQMHFDDAEKQYRLVLETRRTIVRDAPDSLAMKRDLAIAHTRLGDLQLKRSNPQAAQQSYAAALSIIEPMLVTRSGYKELQRDLSAIYQQMGDALLVEHQYEAALDWLDRDLALSETLARDLREPRQQIDLASTYDRHARALALLGRNSQALEEYGRGTSLLEAVISSYDAPPSWQRDAAALLESMAKLLARMGESGQAVRALKRALAIREGLAASFEEVSWQQELVESYRRASEMMLDIRQPSEALDLAEQYLLAVSLGADSDGAKVQRTGRALGTLCWSALNAKNIQRAVWAGRNGIELAPGLSWIRLNYAHALMLSGDREAAKNIYFSGLTLEEKALVLKDFNTLRARGIHDMLMEEITTRLGS